MNDYEKKLADFCGVENIGDVSDGYHTFNQLYHQRAILFACIVMQNKDKAWKTRNHEDGTPCFGGGWFLVTIDTPEGSYGYHYEDRYWDIFDCAELESAKPWDGYTEEQVTRLLSLRQTVDHPTHYNKPGRKECIEEMLDEFGPEAVYWFCKLNAYKYEYRAGDKGPADVDLNKAAWYSKYAHNLTKQFDILELNTGGTQE
jgi:hypothetical protein